MLFKLACNGPRLAAGGQIKKSFPAGPRNKSIFIYGRGQLGAGWQQTDVVRSPLQN